MARRHLSVQQAGYIDADFLHPPTFPLQSDGGPYISATWPNPTELSEIRLCGSPLMGHRHKRQKRCLGFRVAHLFEKPTAGRSGLVYPAIPSSSRLGSTLLA